MSESTNSTMQENQPLFFQLIKTARGAIRELDQLHHRVLTFLIIDEIQLPTTAMRKAYALLADHDREVVLSELSSRWLQICEALDLNHDVTLHSTPNLRYLSVALNAISEAQPVFSDMFEQRNAALPIPDEALWRSRKTVSAPYMSEVIIEFSVSNCSHIMIITPDQFNFDPLLITLPEQNCHSAELELPMISGEVVVLLRQAETGTLYKESIKFITEEDSLDARRWSHRLSLLFKSLFRRSISSVGVSS